MIIIVLSVKNVVREFVITKLYFTTDIMRTLYLNLSLLIERDRSYNNICIFVSTILCWRVFVTNFFV